MTRVGRAFVAVVPPPAVLDAIAERVRAVSGDGPALRWMARAQWHLTMQFLGRVDDLDVVVDAATRAAASVGAFEMQLAGSGAFPSARRAAVLWLGVGTGTDALGALARGVAEAFAPLGYPPEDRPFHPHLTVARASRPRRADHVIAAIGGGSGDVVIGPAWQVRDVVLYESRTRPEGAEYGELARLPFGG
ncbi:MAG: RNA 2',3'-cyclic phosphodiesterase [Acidimicrobiia bacterium]